MFFKINLPVLKEEMLQAKAEIRSLQVSAFIWIILFLIFAVLCAVKFDSVDQAAENTIVCFVFFTLFAAAVFIHFLAIKQEKIIKAWRDQKRMKMKFDI